MSDSLKYGFSLPPEQQAIQDKCFHPSGTFVEFPMGGCRDFDPVAIREDRALLSAQESFLE